MPVGRVRAETTRSRLHAQVRLGPLGRVRLPVLPVGRVLVRVPQVLVQVPQVALAVPLPVVRAQVASLLVRVEQAEPLALAPASVAAQAEALRLQVAVPQQVAADAAEAPQVPSVVRAPGQREGGSQSAQSAWNTSSSRLPPLVACRFLVATATRRCACAAARR